MNGHRLQKVNTLINQDLSSYINRWIQKEGIRNLLVSVTKVATTSDLSLARVYLSVYPIRETEKILTFFKQNKSKVREQIGRLNRQSFKKIPDLAFFADDSLEYMEQIETALAIHKTSHPDPSES